MTISFADGVDLQAVPPLLPGDVARVLPNGLPTEQQLDYELAQGNWYQGSVETLQQQTTQLLQATNNNSAEIDHNATVAANATAAVAADLATVSTTVGDNTAAISTLTASYNGIAAEYSLSGTISGTMTPIFVVTGAKKNDGTGAIYGIAFTASSFMLTDPSYNGGLPGNVFSYSSTVGAWTFNVPVLLNAGNLSPGAVSSFYYYNYASSISLGNATTNVTLADVPNSTFGFTTDGDATILLSWNAKLLVRGDFSYPTYLQVFVWLDGAAPTRLLNLYISTTLDTDGSTTSGPTAYNFTYKTKVTGSGAHSAKLIYNYVSTDPSGYALMKNGSEVMWEVVRR